MGGGWSWNAHPATPHPRACVHHVSCCMWRVAAHLVRLRGALLHAAVPQLQEGTEVAGPGRRQPLLHVAPRNSRARKARGPHAGGVGGCRLAATTFGWSDDRMLHATCLARLPTTPLGHVVSGGTGRARAAAGFAASSTRAPPTPTPSQYSLYRLCRSAPCTDPAPRTSMPPASARSTSGHPGGRCCSRAGHSATRSSCSQKCGGHCGFRAQGTAGGGARRGAKGWVRWVGWGGVDGMRCTVVVQVVGGRGGCVLQQPAGHTHSQPAPMRSKIQDPSELRRLPAIVVAGCAVSYCMPYASTRTYTSSAPPPRRHVHVARGGGGDCASSLAFARRPPGTFNLASPPTFVPHLQHRRQRGGRQGAKPAKEGAGRSGTQAINQNAP